MLAGGDLQSHSEMYRARILGELDKDDPRALANEEKIQDSRKVDRGECQEEGKAEEDGSWRRGGARTEALGDGNPLRGSRG